MNEFRFALLRFYPIFVYCVAFSLSTWQTSNSHADSTPLTEQVLQDLMKYLQMSRYKDEDCVMTAPPYTPNNGDGWNISKNEIKIFSLIKKKKACERLIFTFKILVMLTWYPFLVFSCLIWHWDCKNKIWSPCTISSF